MLTLTVKQRTYTGTAFSRHDRGRNYSKRRTFLTVKCVKSSFLYVINLLFVFGVYIIRKETKSDFISFTRKTIYKTESRSTCKRCFFFHWKELLNEKRQQKDVLHSVRMIFGIFFSKKEGSGKKVFLLKDTELMGTSKSRFLSKHSKTLTIALTGVVASEPIIEQYSIES